MKRLFSLLALLTFTTGLLSPLAALAQAATGQLKDFEITAPTEVNINEAFNVTIKAVGEDGNKLSTYEGMVYIETNKALADVVFPTIDGEAGYKFGLSDQGEHEIQK